MVTLAFYARITSSPTPRAQTEETVAYRRIFPVFTHDWQFRIREHNACIGLSTHVPLTVNYAKLRDTDSPDTLFPLLERYWS